MKPFKLLLLIASFLTCYLNTSAQTTKGLQDVSISYGKVSGREIVDGSSTSDETGNGIFDNTDNANGHFDVSKAGNYFISYRYFVANRCAVGFTVGNQNIQGEVYDADQSPNQSVFNFTLRNTTVATELLFEYSNKKWVQVYLLAGIGASFFNYAGYNDIDKLYGLNRQSGVRFNCQISPFGIRVGRKFGYFLECGMGYKGLINSGFSYRISQLKSKKPMEK